MPYFQNPFDQLFRGSWSQDLLSWEVPGNLNSSNLMIAWQAEPYDLSGNPNLTLNYNLEMSKAYYASVVFPVAGVVPAATMAREVAAALNANAEFSGLWQASTRGFSSDPMAPQTVVITSRKPRETMKMYVSNTGAEMEMRFNLKAPIAEMPTYFRRHTIANYGVYEGGEGVLIELDPAGNAYHHLMITQAGFDADVLHDDWEMLKGRSGFYIFKRNVYDGSGRLTQTLEYHAGARGGDLAKLVSYGYTGGGANPTTITEEPYSLLDSDLISPP